MLQAKLIVVGGEVKTKEVNLRLPCVIGRGREATLTLPHALVSRTHCELFERDGRLVVRDLGSLNGTYVNNYRITSEQPVLPGELITVGTVTFRADYQTTDDPRAGKPTEPTLPAQNGSAVAATSANSPPDFKPIPSSEFRASKNDTTVAGRWTARPNPDSVPLSNPQTVASPAATPQTVASQAIALQAAALQKAAGQTPPSDELPASGPAPDLAREGATTPPPRDIENTESSDIFSSFDFGQSPEKSISFSALEALPGASVRQVSFVGPIGDLPPNSALELDPTIQILDDQNASPAVESDDSQLGSFIRKLPR